MNSIVYAAVKYTQVRHAIQCRKCLETIYTRFQNVFLWGGWNRWRNMGWQSHFRKSMGYGK
jgi:hypothetical protein